MDTFAPITELPLDEDVRRLLEAHRGQWKTIAHASGVSYSWLSKFSRRTISNPGFATLQRLRFCLLQSPLPQRLPPVPPPVAPRPPVNLPAIASAK